MACVCQLLPKSDAEFLQLDILVIKTLVIKQAGKIIFRNINKDCPFLKTEDKRIQHQVSVYSNQMLRRQKQDGRQLLVFLHLELSFSPTNLEEIKD